MVYYSTELAAPSGLTIKECNRLPGSSRCKNKVRKSTCPSDNNMICISRWCTNGKKECPHATVQA